MKLRPIAELSGAAIFLLLWLLVPFWKIATLQTINIQDDIYASDLWNDRLPARAFIGQSLRRGEFPLWIPGIYTGYPALGHVEAGALYPSNLLLFASLPPYAAFAYAQLLPLFLAGLGAFLLARRVGADRLSALLAAASFSLSGFFVSHLRHVNMLDAACWIPFLLLAVETALDSGGGRAGVALAVVWALQLLAGHPQISYFTALVLSAWTLAAWRRRNREPSSAPFGWVARQFRDPAILRLALGVLLGTAVAGAALLPALELAQASRREGGLAFAEAARYAASPANLWTFFLPYVNGDPSRDTYRLSGLFWEQYAYVGLPTIALAIAAVVLRRGESVIRMLVVMAVLAYLLALGDNTPLFFLAHRFVPGMAYFRFPTRFLAFVDLALALLAALGLSWVLARVGNRMLRIGIAAGVLVLTGLDLGHHQMRQVPQVGWSAWTAPIYTERFLSDRRRASPEPWRYHSLESASVHVQTFHAARGWAGDLTPYVWLRGMLQPSYNLLFDLESPDGYANLVPRRYEAIWGSEKESGLLSPSGRARGDSWDLSPRVIRLLRLFNVRYVLAAWNVSSPDLRLAYRSPDGIDVHELDRFLPRAFVVGSVRNVSSDREGLDVLKSAEFEPLREAVIHDPGFRLPDGSASSTEVRVTRRTARRVELETSLENPGLLVLSEGYYPGWAAEIDGVEAACLRTNVMMRAAVVPAGDHRVVFSFRSRSVELGAAMTFAGVLGLIATGGWLASPPRGNHRPRHGLSSF